MLVRCDCDGPNGIIYNGMESHFKSCVITFRDGFARIHKCETCGKRLWVEEMSGNEVYSEKGMS